MLAQLARRRARRGITIIEAALVLSVFLLLLFGIFEYCRFLLILHITNNAARDGARQASVLVTSTATAATTRQQIIDYTTARMGGTQKNIEGFSVAVYAVDQAGLDLATPVFRAKSKTSGVYPDPFNPSDPNHVDWNSAPFPERIAVTIKGTYRPLLPSFLFMPSSIPIEITAMMGGEG
jgi:Flp pilus assembly protein TadG